jgi:hypothetical protein
MYTFTVALDLEAELAVALVVRGLAEAGSVTGAAEAVLGEALVALQRSSMAEA